MFNRKKKDKKKTHASGKPLLNPNAKVQNVSGAGETGDALREAFKLAEEAKAATAAKAGDAAPPPVDPPSDTGSAAAPPPQRSLHTTAVGVFPDGEELHLKSSNMGPAFDDPGLTRPLKSALHWATHVEGHTAASMRARGLTELTLTTNHPLGVCAALHAQAPAMMPPGATMVVISPDGEGTRTQWLDQQGVHHSDPRLPAAPGPTGNRIRLTAGGCWAAFDHWFDDVDGMWSVVTQLAKTNPFFFEVSHEGHQWRPFSLISGQDGMVVTRFLQSAEPFMMRLYGASMKDMPAIAFRDVLVEWTTPVDGESPVTLRLPTIHHLSMDHAEFTARSLMQAEEPDVYQDVPVFPG